jgi:hypothetical protein
MKLRVHFFAFTAPTEGLASLHSFKHSSPEQRYLNLLETRPDLFQRVPLHQLASYSGMKAESLSRIRKRILTDAKS